MSSTPLTVIKADGTIEPFSMEKFRRSMDRAKVPADMSDHITKQICDQYGEMCSTEDLRNNVQKILTKQNRYSAVRYTTRDGIMKLGPSGYAFEKFIGQVFEALGFRSSTGVIIPGRCVNHEIDVMAIKDNSVDLAECKYHNAFGIKSDIKIALYVWARSEDVRSAWSENGVQGKPLGNYWLVTNTKLTNDALTYAQCKGLQILSWNYPEDRSLRILIDEYGLYPLTTLRSLKSHTLTALIDRGIVTISQLLTAEKRQLSDLSEAEIHAAQKEAQEILRL